MLARRRPVTIAICAVAVIAAAFALTRPGAPTAADPLQGLTATAAGGDHTCAVLSTGGLECWGDNTYGELGDGTTVNRAKLVPVSGLSSGVATVAAGSNHTCALLTSGGVKCWGYNRYGQLGNGTATGATTANPVPVDVSGLSSGVVAIAAGGAHTCALLDTGGVKCWGWNRRGQIGDGEDCSTSSCRRLAPTDVTGLASGVVAIAAGVYHNCAVLATGGVKCWGQNDTAQLGVTTGSPCVDETLAPISCAPTPLDVPGVGGIAAIAAGGGHTCALTHAGSAWCWGDNSSGQLGDGGGCGATCISPVATSGLASGVTVIVAGGGHSCALLNDTRVRCWGTNGLGQVGNGNSPNESMTPVDVCADVSCGEGFACIPEFPCGALTGVVSVTLGKDHSCALAGDGGLACWGDNAHGQLGDAQACGSSCDTPAAVRGVKGALPDLIVTAMRTELETGGSCAFTSTALGVRVEFANIGAADAGPFVVAVNGATRTFSAGLAAGGTGSLWFQGYPFGGSSSATIDATGQVQESNEANNRLIESLPVPTLPATCTPTPTGTLTPTVTPTPTARAGDANCDGSVNSIDAALVLQYGAGLLGALPCRNAADVNHDGSVNAIDAALILQYVAGLLGIL